MTKLSISLAGVALIGFAAARADAQCAFDGPAKAKGMKVSLVRSYAGCPAGSVPFPGSVTGTNVPSCAPPFAHSYFEFAGPSSGCSVKTSAKLEAPCLVNGDPQSDNCMNMSVQASCSGIVSDGVSLIDGVDQDGADWALVTVTRATFDDPESGDMIVISFPLQFDFPPAVNGKLSVKMDTNAILTAWGLDPFPDCTQLEIVSLSIRDPDGAAFAKIGASARPTGF